MGVITSTAGGGNLSAGGSWVGGVAPTFADDAVIATTGANKITLDAAGLRLKSLTINTNAALALQSAVAADLLIENGITNNGKITGDLSAAPTVNAKILWNNANTGVGGGAATQFNTTDPASFDLIGAPKKRRTTTTTTNVVGDDGTAGKLIGVVDATGWRQGDKIVFASTQAYNAVPKVDVMTLAGTYVNGSTALVFTSGMVYNHASGCVVGNLTANVVLGPAVAGYACEIAYIHQYAATSILKRLRDVALNSLNGSYPNYGFCLNGNSQYPPYSADNVSIDNCVFYDYRSYAIFHNLTQSPYNERTGNIFYSANQAASSPVIACLNGNVAMANDTDLAIFGGDTGVQVAGAAYVMKNPSISGIKTGPALDLHAAVACTISNADIFAANQAVTFGACSGKITASRFGTQYAGAASNTALFDYGVVGQMDLTDCQFQAGGTFNNSADLAAADLATKITLVNKNADVTKQEIYTPLGQVIRNNATTKRSTSSVSIKPSVAGSNVTYTSAAPVTNGATVRLIGYCQFDASWYNTNNYFAPTVTISDPSGNVLATYTATAAANGAWEKFDISATNATGADCNLVITLTAKAKAVTSGTVYFDGVVMSPFVTKARHYGFTFDESNPWRTVNAAGVASEATAAAYGEVTYTGGVSASASTVTADTTFQKLYDGGQAWACLNLGYAPPSAAPVAGVLVAGGNVTVNTTKKLNGSGSIAMGAYTLATEFAGSIAYSFTGGTWAQAAASPSFSGGTLTLGTATVYPAFSAAGSTINFTATSAAWDLSSGSFSGTITLVNTSGAPITVAMPTPSGFTIVNTGTGAAAITVTSPTISAPITWAAALNGTTVIVYNDSQAGYMLDGGSTVGSGGYTLNLTLPHAHAAIGDTIRLRHCKIDKYAGELVGVLTASGLAFIGSQTTHDIYAAWGINGALCDQANGGEFTADYTHIDIDIVGAGSVSNSQKKRLGAWTQYLLTLPAGLDAFYGGFTLESVGSIRQNVGVVDVLLKKTSAGNVQFTDIDVRYYRSDFSLPYDPAGNAIFMDYEGVPFVVTTSSQAVNQATVEAALLALGYTAARAAYIDKVVELHKLDGLDAAAPLVVDNDAGTRSAGAIVQTVGTAGNVTTVQRV